MKSLMHFTSLCSIIDKKTLVYNAFKNHIRFITGYRKRIREEENAKKIVYQYASKNTKHTERVYACGYAATGALGVRNFLRPSTGFPPRQIQHYPYRIKFFDQNNLKIYNIACGYGYTVFACKSRDHEHCLYGTGINTDSQIGFHESPPKSGRILDFLIEPARIQLPGHVQKSDRITHLACGRAHTFVVTERNKVYSLGNNSLGQCGRKIVKDEIFSHSQLINSISSIDKQIKQIVCGQDHTLVLTSDGKVYSCGLGADGQTGQGHYNVTHELQLVKGDIENENIAQIACKADTVLAVSEKGDVFGWGNSEYKQLELIAGNNLQVHTPTYLPYKEIGKVTCVAAAGSSCAVLNDQGDVFTWGYGILGKGPKLESSGTPCLIPNTIFGRNQFNPDSRVVNLYCGMNSFAALTSHGDLYTWGRNKSGTLGLNSKLDQFFPFKVNVGSRITKVWCGVDHMFMHSKSFA